MITAYSYDGACIGSGRDSSSSVLIDGGTICLVKENNESGRKAAHIGKGYESTQAPTDVTITGGTICLIGADRNIPRPIIYGWEKAEKIIHWLKKQVLKEAPTAFRMSGQIPAEGSICTFRHRRQ